MSSSPPYTALSQGGSVPFPTLAARYLREYQEKIHQAVAGLSEEQMWWRPAPHANSAANLLLHLAGNLSLWILNGVGGETNPRHRAAEFAADHSVSKAEALARFDEVIARCRQLLETLPPAGLDEEIDLQTYRMDRLHAIFHATEHCSYHAGQIVWIAKALTPDRPFEFYPRHASE